MLHRILTEHAAEVFYGDEKLVELLWTYAISSEVGIAADPLFTLQQQYYDVLVEGVESRYPREHRLTDVRQLLEHICDGDLFAKKELPWLNELQQRLFYRNGDLLCYRDQTVQAYVRLAAGLDPTLLVGWHLALWLECTPEPTEGDIRRVVEAQTPFFAPQGIQTKPFAEGHVHYGGVTVDSIILGNYLFDGHRLSSGKSGNSWQRNQRINLSMLLQRARELLQLLLCSSRQKWDDRVQDWLKDFGKKLVLPDWALLSAGQLVTSSSEPNWLLGEFATSVRSGSPNSWLWLHLFLCRSYRANETVPAHRAAILCFWQTVNLLRRTLIMDGQGLTRFTERYAHPTLGRREKNQRDKIRRLWAQSTDVAEIKFTPGSFNAESLRHFAKEFTEHLGIRPPQPPYIFGEHEVPYETTCSNLKNLERLQICGHFSRSVPYKHNQKAYPNCKAIWLEAENLYQNLQAEAGWNAPEFLGGKLNPHFQFQPARWFRGLDVAGDENALKIEWFAPVLRWLRSGFKQRPYGEQASTGFHLSIHAGEDYAHPASGMRHIDETVRFCMMRDGDRLGHALALGIEPKQWAERQGEMILPLHEHLDNLVWLWHYATLLCGILPLAQQVLPILERRVARFWCESTWWQVPNYMVSRTCSNQQDTNENSELRHAKPGDLYQAWCLRRNCYYRLKSLADGWPINSKEQEALPDYETLQADSNMASQLYLSRHAWLQQKQLDRMVIVRVGNEIAANCLHQPQVCSEQKSRQLEDVDTPVELEFMHAVQDWLLTEYDQIGLIIETNPTSNVYIARLKSHAEHPIFRWFPPDESVLENGASANRYGLRRGPVRVLVNTDDPGIMPTTLRTEFQLLREAALQQEFPKIGRTLAERWLETLRQFGMDQFHRNHLPIFEPN